MEKQNKGITLIALVITTIVLLILAGVSIRAVIGDNGIISKSVQSKEKTLVAEEGENVRLAVAAAFTNGMRELNTSNLQDAIDDQFGEGARNNLSGEGPWEYTGKYKIYEIDKTGNVSEEDIKLDVTENYEAVLAVGDDAYAYLVKTEDSNYEMHIIGTGDVWESSKWFAIDDDTDLVGSDYIRRFSFKW